MKKEFSVIRINDTLYVVVDYESRNLSYNDWFIKTDNQGRYKDYDRMDSSLDWVYKDSPKIIATIGESLPGVPLILIHEEDDTKEIDKEYVDYCKSNPEYTVVYQHFVDAYRLGKDKYLQSLQKKEIKSVVLEYERVEPNPQTFTKEYDEDDVKYELKINPDDNIIPLEVKY